MNEYVSLKKNNEFRRLYSKGRFYQSPLIVTYVIKTRRNCVRVGITTSKKIGNAVLRNRSRRIIRESYRSLLPELKTGYDIVFVARGKTPFVPNAVEVLAAEKQVRAFIILSAGFGEETHEGALLEDRILETV